MKESLFQFSNPILKNFYIVRNDDFDQDLFDGMCMESTVGTHVISENEEALVSLKINLGKKSNLFPFYIEMEMSAAFKMQGSATKEEFEKYISINAPALLLSYSRPIVSMMTAQSGLPSFNLPFMNFKKK